MEVIQRPGDALSAREVYEVWRLRDAVFAVEQQCDEPDVDGVDLEATCTHLWLAEDDRLVSYLRTFTDERGTRHVGRVCTRADRRGRGLSARLLDAVHARWGGADIELGAQAHLEGWYAGFGYARSGEPYREAGIDHVPMLRPARAS